MSQIGTDKAPNRFLTMFGRFADWFGSLKSDNAKLNDEVNADAVRIASLEAANNEMARHLAAARNDLARAMQGNAAWSAKCKDLQDKLDRVSSNFDGYIDESWPLMEAGRKRKEADARYRAKQKQKANRARYDAKRRGKA